MGEEETGNVHTWGARAYGRLKIIRGTRRARGNDRRSINFGNPRDATRVAARAPRSPPSPLYRPKRVHPSASPSECPISRTSPRRVVFIAGSSATR